MPRFTVNLVRHQTLTQTAIVGLDAPDRETAENTPWEDDWATWENISGTDEIEKEIIDETEARATFAIAGIVPLGATRWTSKNNCFCLG